MAHELLGLSMNEFLYEYNMEFLSYMLTQKIELQTGKTADAHKEEVETIEARDLFGELGF